MKCDLLNFCESEIKKDNVINMLNIFCGIRNIKTNFTFGILNDLGKIKYYIISEDDNFHILLKQKLKLIYQSLEFQQFDIEFFEKEFNTNSKFCRMKLKLDEPDTLITEGKEEIFMDNLLNAIYSNDNISMNIIEFSFYPICKTISNSNKINYTKKILKYLLKGTSFILECFLSTDDNQNKVIQKKEEHINNFLYACSIKIGVKNKGLNNIQMTLEDISSTFTQLNNKNIFLTENISSESMFNRLDYNMLLSTNEISQFFNLPTEKNIENVIGKSITKILNDNNVPSEGIVIAKTNDDIPIAIPAPTIILNKDIYSSIYKQHEKEIDNLCKCKLVMGLPGSGKSEWIVSYCIRSLYRGIPFILIDPKFDSQKRLIESLPEQFLDNVDFLDLGDLVYPPAFNIFRRRKENNATENGLITTSFISYMKKQFGRSWGFNLERMIQMTTDAILLDDISTMTEFYWMLKEEIYRKFIIDIIEEKLKQPKVENKSRLKQLLNYWKEYQQKYEKNPLSINKEIEPVMNKIGMFIGNRFINAIVSQRQSYDFKQAGNNQKSVIINVPEGIINSENMSLLCGFISKAIWLDYQSRDDMEMCNRYPVQWIIDEAATIIDEEFIGIMAKARSRRLGLTFACQRFMDLDKGNIKLSDSIRDNCKTKIIYKIGYSDARIISEEFAPLTPNNLSDCPDHYFYGRMLLNNGTISKPFLGTPIPIMKPLRNYDEYKQNHRSGKLTIEEIEEQIDDRLEMFETLTSLNN